MSKVLELVWFHIKPNASQTRVMQALDGIKDQLGSLPGLDAVYYGKGTTIPQGFIGMNVVKVWSSEKAQNLYFESPTDYEYKIAKDVMDTSDPFRPPNSVSFLVSPDVDIEKVLTAPVTLLSCLWLPAPVDKNTFSIRKQQLLHNQGQECQFASTIYMWSVPGSSHPTVGATDGFLSLTACENVEDANDVANNYGEVLAQLVEFSQLYDHQFTSLTRIV